MEEWKKEFDKKFSNRRTLFDSVNRNSWGYVREGKYHNGTSTHCFAGMYSIGTGTTHILNGIHISPLPKDMVERYYDWLFNRSPYAPIFITKDVKSVMEEAIEVIDANHPANLIVGGMTASRTASEYPYIVMVWDKLVKLKVHENVAFYFAHLFRCKYKNPETLGIVPAMWNHTAIQTIDIPAYTGGGNPDGYVENFIHGIMTFPNPPYSQNTSYLGVQKIWGGTTGKRTVRRDIIDWFNKLPAISAGNNPFAKPVKLEVDADFALHENLSNVHTVSFSSSIKLIAKYLRDGYKGEFN